MTERNLKQQLQYFYYDDMMDGRTIETIDYESLIDIIDDLYVKNDELKARVEALEKDKEQWFHPQSSFASSVL